MKVQQLNNIFFPNDLTLSWHAPSGAPACSPSFKIPNCQLSKKQWVIIETNRIFTGNGSKPELELKTWKRDKIMRIRCPL